MVQRSIPATLICAALALGAPRAVHGQDRVAAAPPMIDTIIVVRDNVFTADEAQEGFAFRLMNSLHIVTLRPVIRAELLFRQGEPYDSVKIQESERNLRARQLFKFVRIDSTRVDGKLAVIVRTQDGWSTKPKFKLTVASDGTWTGALGITEINLLGSGNLAHLAYRKDVDRKGWEVIGDWRRMFGSALRAYGEVLFWDDGTVGNWTFGDPFYSFADPLQTLYQGEAADQRVLQFFVEDPAAPDTTFLQRRAFINMFKGVVAPMAGATRYLRVGATGGIRNESYILQEDTALAIPDTLYGEFGVFGEYKTALFEQVRYFNGFADEDIDLGTSVKLGVNLAATGLGYRRTGIGPVIELQTGKRFRNFFIQTTLKANGLFSDAGLDSGRVVLDATFGFKPWPRHSTAFYITAGRQKNPAPGQQFDLGFETPPRSWQPHSFVGTRMVWGTVEHRWYRWEGFLNLFSLGLAGFVDYGGAWYEGQDPRFGGNVGIGLRAGSALSTVARTGRLDLGYRFGDGVTGSRWVLTFGAGFVFPWKSPTPDVIPGKQ